MIYCVIEQFNTPHILPNNNLLLKSMGRTRQNFLIVILCLFLANVWLNYNSPQVLLLKREANDLQKELVVIQREHSGGQCMDTCPTEVRNFRRREIVQENEELRRQRQRLEDNRVVCGKNEAGTVLAKNQCDLATLEDIHREKKREVVKKISEIKSELARVEQEFLELKNKVQVAQKEKERYDELISELERKIHQ